MPMRKELYPSNWKQISLEARKRANWQCEECGVKNGATGARDLQGQWHDENAIHSLNSDECYRLFGDNFNRKMTRIVLTVHHLSEDKMDCRPENLISLCQRCHLLADLETHIANRRVTLARKRLEKIAATGQKSLFGEDE